MSRTGWHRPVTAALLVGDALVLAAGLALVLADWRLISPDARSLEQLILIPPSFTFGVVAALLAWRRPENRLGPLLAAIAFFGALAGGALLYWGVGYAHPALLPESNWALWVNNWSWAPEYLLVPTLLPALFPDGRLPSDRWRPFAWFVGALLAVTILLQAVALSGFETPSGHFIANPIHLPGQLGIEAYRSLTKVVIFVFVVAFAFGLASLVARWRRAGAVERQQIKWFGFAVVASVVLLVVDLVGVEIGASSQQVLSVLEELGLNLVPLAIAVAVLRYRLYDIDLVINKSLVYGALAAFITLFYVAIVVGIGELVGSGRHPNLLLSVVAVAIVAVAFQPARERLQRLANRLVYGRRATPYEALATFARRLSGAVSAEELLPKVAEAAATSLNVSWARATLYLGGGGEQSGEWGRPEGSQLESVPVRHEGELLGAIELRSPEPLTGERTGRVISHLANQTGAAFRNIRLTLELQGRLERISRLAAEMDQSRQRIVAAAEAGRRRLEAEISQTTQQQLAGIEAELGQAHRLLVEGDPEAGPLLDTIATQTNAALDGLRDLARGVFPPLLIDKGVVPALQAHLRKLGGVDLQVPPDLAERRFPGPVEAALYFSCVEALRGVDRGSIRLQGDGEWLECRVEAPAAGGSLLDIQDRVEALGGAVERSDGHIDVRLPVRDPNSEH